MDVTVRASRRRLLGILSTVTAAHAFVLLTSEREGPGSAQLRVESGASRANAAAPSLAVVADAPTAVPAAEPISVTPIAPTETAIVAAPPAATATSAPVPTAAPLPTVAPSPTVAVAAAPIALSPPVVIPPVASAPASQLSYVDEAPSTNASSPKPAAAAPSKPTQPGKGERLPPTQTMPGGRNNYSQNAPLVPNLGKGFIVTGTVLDTAGTPVGNTRIQIWLNTARGGEREPSNRGSVMTDVLGKYRLETSPVMPVFGQPHVHIAYDDGKFDTLFLRPVLKTEKDPSITVDFVLGPNGAA